MSAPPPSDPPVESTAARLVGELLAAGEAVDEGVFTIDPTAAAAKLEAFTYADRSYYLVPIIEGLHGLGAREVAVETGIKDLAIRGRGIQLDAPAERLRELYTHAISSGGDPQSRALGRIAVGLDMMLGGSPTASVELRYSNPSTAVVAECRWRQAPQLREEQPSVLRELEIRIDNPWLQGPSPRREAIERLRAAVQFSDRLVSLDDARISREPRAWRETIRGEGPGYRFTAGLEPRSDGFMTELWTAGVCAERLTRPGLGFRAVIELDAPRRDLSQMQIIRDDVLEHALSAVEQVHRDALAELELAATRLPAQLDLPHTPDGRALERQVREPPSKHVVTKPLSAVTLLGLRGLLHEGWKTSRIVLAILAIGMGSVIGFFALLMWREGFAGGQLLSYAVLCWAIGGLPVISLANDLKRVIRARDHGLRTHATVTGIWEPAPSPAIHTIDGRVLWSFADQAGVERSGRSATRTIAEAKLWLPGETIAVYYHPAHPNESWWEADIGPSQT